MLHSVNTRLDDNDDACRGHAVATATPVCADRGLFAAALASSWSFAEDVVPVMDRSVAVTYGCYDPPPTPSTFPSPPSLLPSSMFHATAAAGIGEPHYHPPSHHNDVEATPPYYIGDRRLPLDYATNGVYGGISMQYHDTKAAVAGGGVPSPDDRDCSMRAVILAGDARMRTPANLTPPPSMFAWRGPQTSCSLSTADYKPVGSFPSYYPNIVVDQPSCHSPVGADRKSLMYISISIVPLKNRTAQLHKRTCRLCKRQVRIVNLTHTFTIRILRL